MSLTDIEQVRKQEFCKGMCQFALCPIKTEDTQVNDTTKQQKVTEAIVLCNTCGFHFDLSFE